MRYSLALFLTALWAAPALAMPVPDCAGGVEISRAHIVRVEKNGALILADGRAVLLEGIRLPTGGAVADDAIGQLRSLAMAGPLTLTSTPPKEDRYDRVRVQAFGDVWLQLEMLKRGLAQVQISPDRNECAPDFYDAEQDARAASRGLWALPAYAVRTSLKNATGSFQIVEGKVTNAQTRDGRTVLDFSAGFSAVIAQEDRKAFRDLDPALETLTGRRLRIRGTVEDENGHPVIALSNPAQIEMLN